MEETLLWVLDRPETRVVGLFLETARRPDLFRLALELAAARDVAVAAIKVGNHGWRADWRSAIRVP